MDTVTINMVDIVPWLFIVPFTIALGVISAIELVLWITRMVGD